MLKTFSFYYFHIVLVLCKDGDLLWKHFFGFFIEVIRVKMRNDHCVYIDYFID